MALRLASYLDRTVEELFCLDENSRGVIQKGK
jgi:hypothetical protein